MSPASRAVRTWGPWALLALTGGLTAFLATQEPTGQLQGWVDAPGVELRAPEDGEITFVAVDSTLVEDGAPALTVRSHAVEAELARAQAQLAELSRGTARDVADDAVRTTELRASERAAQADAAAARAEAKALGSRLDELEELAARGVGDAAEVAELQARRAALLAEVAGHEARARLYAEATTSPPPLSTDDPLLAAAQARVDALEARLAGLTVTAPLTGRVKRLTAARHVEAGEPVAQLTPDTSSRAILCLSEGMPSLTPGQRLTVRPLAGGDLLEGTVLDGDGPLEATDTRCGGHPALPTWSRRVRLTLDTPLPAGARLRARP